MSDIFEVNIVEESLELSFTDDLLEVLIQEDNFELSVNTTETEVLISSDEIEILTIAEQGPAGIGGEFPIAVGNTPPINPEVGDLWLDTN